MRLVDGSIPSEGRVEVLHNGQWGTICDDTWSIEEAEIVCHQLGYSSAIDALVNAYFGEGSGEIWLDNVHCSGSESGIHLCSHEGWGVHNCQHYEDAGVRCFNGKQKMD